MQTLKLLGLKMISYGKYCVLDKFAQWWNIYSATAVEIQVHQKFLIRDDFL